MFLCPMLKFLVELTWRLYLFFDMINGAASLVDRWLMGHDKPFLFLRPCSFESALDIRIGDCVLGVLVRCAICCYRFQSGLSHAGNASPPAWFIFPMSIFSSFLPFF